MTAKSKRESNKAARKATKKGSLNAAARKSNRGARKTMKKDTLYGSAEPVSHGTPRPSAEVISAGRAGESLECAKPNAQGLFLQNFVDEWFEFVGKRTRQHMHLIDTIQSCRTLPDLQQAYAEFWQNAFTQYAEEPRRMQLVPQGGVDHTAPGKEATDATLHYAA